MRFVAPIQLQKSDVIQFVHCPKTGGTSLNSLITSQFKPEQIFTLGANIGETVERARKIDFKEIRYISGHSPAGRFKPILGFIQYPLIISVLRQPENQLISNFRHISSKRHHPLNKVYKSENVDLIGFCLTRKYHMQSYNVQTRHLAGAMPGIQNWVWGIDSISEQTILELAKQRLEQCVFIGIMDDPIRSLELLEFTFGWKFQGSMPHLNSAVSKTDFKACSENETEAIMYATKLDRKLFNYSKRLFEQRYTEMVVAKNG